VSAVCFLSVNEGLLGGGLGWVQGSPGGTKGSGEEGLDSGGDYRGFAGKEPSKGGVLFTVSQHCESRGECAWLSMGTM